MHEPPVPADTTFRRLLNREILVSERRRMLGLAAMLAVILALILLVVTLSPVSPGRSTMIDSPCALR
jgi:predicted nucleic acid-binding Zn ribbon protein